MKFNYITNKLYLYFKLIRMDKPAGMFALLWPTLIGLWIASNGNIPLDVLWLFVAGVFVTRTAGCIVNDLTDMRFDIHVKRTCQRPLAAQLVRRQEAYIILSVFVIFAIYLFLQLNKLAQIIGFLAAILTVVYPWLKRITYYPQFCLGGCFAASSLMAFAQICNYLPLTALVLFAAIWCWVVAFDTQYALVDKCDDIKIGIKSTAIIFAQWDLAVVGLLQIIFIGHMLLLGWDLGLQTGYYVGLSAASGIFYWQYKITKTRARIAYWNAFVSNNLVGAVIMLGLVASRTILYSCGQII